MNVLSTSCFDQPGQHCYVLEAQVIRLLSSEREPLQLRQELRPADNCLVEARVSAPPF